MTTELFPALEIAGACAEAKETRKRAAFDKLLSLDGDVTAGEIAALARAAGFATEYTEAVERLGAKGVLNFVFKHGRPGWKMTYLKGYSGSETASKTDRFFECLRGAIYEERARRSKFAPLVAQVPNSASLAIFVNYRDEFEHFGLSIHSIVDALCACRQALRDAIAVADDAARAAYNSDEICLEPLRANPDRFDSLFGSRETAPADSPAVASVRKAFALLDSAVPL